MTKPKSELAVVAHDIYESIIQIKSSIALNILELGRLLNEVHDKELYRALDHETFEEFLADPHLGFKRSSAYDYIRLYKVYVVGAGCAAEQLKDVEWTKLLTAARVVEKLEDKKDVDEWIGKTRELSRSDLNTEVWEYLGVEPPKMARISSPDAPGATISGQGTLSRGVSAYIDYVGKAPCIFHASRKSDPHHFPRTQGRGSKQDDAWKIIPLCRECHQQSQEGGKDWLWTYRYQIFNFFYNYIGRIE
jgi:hypothetical protein